MSRIFFLLEFFQAPLPFLHAEHGLPFTSFVIPCPHARTFFCQTSVHRLYRSAELLTLVYNGHSKFPELRFTHCVN